MKKEVIYLLALFVMCSLLCSCSAGKPPLSSESTEDVSTTPVSDAQIEEAHVLHEYEEYKYDASGHTGECVICHESMPIEEHMFSDAGECEVCSYEKLDVSNFERGYIVEEATQIVTEHTIIKLPAHTFVVDSLEEKVEKLYDTIESVCGLKICDGKYGKDKITIEIVPLDRETFPLVHQDSELGDAYAESSMTVTISKGDLFLGNSNAICHEMSHLAYYANMKNGSCMTYTEGFAEYTSYKVVKYFEENDSEMAACFDTSLSSIDDMRITPSNSIYSRPFEYWIENEFPEEYSWNTSYATGFRLFYYLDDVFCEYTSWIKGYNSQSSESFKTQINAMKTTYGDTVFTDLYDWLQNNPDKFPSQNSVKLTAYDITGLTYTNIYPFFCSFDNPTDLVVFSRTKVIYEDLYIDVTETRKYLEDYKGYPADNLRIELAIEGYFDLNPPTVKLFDENGNLMDIVTAYQVDIGDACYVKLDGRKEVTRIQIDGYERYGREEGWD